MLQHILYLMTCVFVSSHELNELINKEMRDLVPTDRISMGPNQEGKRFQQEHNSSHAYYQSTDGKIHVHAQSVQKYWFVD